jgi:FKBP-type peptidyl-prolyl cis-trans isomerase
MRGSVILFVCLGLVACNRAKDDKSSDTSSVPGPGSGSGGVRKQQIAPPAGVDLKQPPGDATKTASGLIYKKLEVNAAGQAPKRNDTVMINYTGWRQATGETFFTNQGRGQAMPLNLSQTAPGFTEALQQLRTGEKAVLWMPPEIGYKTPPTDSKPETLVYLVEVVDIRAAPAIPDDVGQPPAKATALKSGTKYIVVRPGTGKDNIRPFDTVAYSYTVWDSTGRMIDSNETYGRHPTTVAVYKQAPGMSEMLANTKLGERVRFWVEAEKLAAPGIKPPGDIQKGTLCYEIDVSQDTRPEHEPPLPPADVAKPPPDAKKTAKGTFYKMIQPGPGKDPRHPKETDNVKVNYTGWTTDGRMFDSSFLRNEPAMFNLKSVVPGWTDGIPLMTAGDHMRFWIPKELAYKGQSGKPEGMLVFDVELIEIVTPTGH